MLEERPNGGETHLRSRPARPGVGRHGASGHAAHGAAGGRAGRRRRAGGGQRRGHPARLPRQLRGLRRCRSTHGALVEGALHCPHCSRTSSCPVPAARWTRTGCSSSRCRCCASTVPSRWRWPRERQRPAAAWWPRRWPPAGGHSGVGLRGLTRPGRAARPPPPVTASNATSAAPASRTTTATCCTLSSAGSSACARAAGRCGRAMPSTGRPGAAPCGCPTSTCPTTSGRASRSRSGSPSSWTRPRPAAWSRSTRARRGHRERAALRVLGRLVDAEPGARRRSSPTSRG